jgi:hypothetical protein
VKSSSSSLYECSISYSTLKRSFAPRILTTTNSDTHWCIRACLCFRLYSSFITFEDLDRRNFLFGKEPREVRVYISNFVSD